MDASRRANDEGLHYRGEEIDEEEYGNCFGCHGKDLKKLLFWRIEIGETKESYTGPGEQRTQKAL
eukprot:scaffold5454_cov135-Skeletonema_menzelii.AAC.7